MVRTAADVLLLLFFSFLQRGFHVGSIVAFVASNLVHHFTPPHHHPRHLLVRPFVLFPSGVHRVQPRTFVAGILRVGQGKENRATTATTVAATGQLGGRATTTQSGIQCVPVQFFNGCQDEKEINVD